MIIHFDKKITDKNPALFDFIESKSILYPIYYIMDYRVRKSVNLQKWFAEQVSNSCVKLKEIGDSIKDNKDYDYVMTDILRWVNKNIVYTTDSKKWKLAEVWQTPEETLTSGTGDCEDGTILIAALAHYKGIPSNRWLINCGDVSLGGHAYFIYRPTEYPLNWCFMDWCYYYDKTTPSARTKYYIKDNTIYDDPLKHYLTTWFSFNDKTSYKGIMNK